MSESLPEPPETDAAGTRGGDAADVGDVPLAEAVTAGGRLTATLAQRSVNVAAELDEDAFFTDVEGNETLVGRDDLERAVPAEKKQHFREVDRYWVNKPYAFVIIFRSEKENELKYYLVEPALNGVEEDLLEFLAEKLADAIKYSREAGRKNDTAADRAEVIAGETKRLLGRYNLVGDDVAVELGLEAGSRLSTITDSLSSVFAGSEADDGDVDTGAAGSIYPPEATLGAPAGLAARPRSAVIEEGYDDLTEYQVEKLLYYLRRDFVGYERIDGIKHDVNVEDISCDGYDAPVFVYHTEYEQTITNIEYDPDSLDDFVVKLAQRSGKGISKRQPQVDATLPDGSRAQLTLGTAVSDHGTNYTIRQFKDVPFTPVDLINWHTFSLEEMAFLWLCIENQKSLIFAGGTASGKTTSLNAISLFIPSKAKIVSIEDTREVELPQRNWIASVTRPSFAADDTGDVDEFDLLEAALRQRPEYIVMGEVRGEEGRTLFQVMSTGHTTYTTFHADSVGEVVKRFTTDPINVSKTLFTALDLVSIQAQTRVRGRKVRRNQALTEINSYDAENDEINVQDVYTWNAGADEFTRQPGPQILEEIMFDRGWSRRRLEDELHKREVILAYLIDRRLSAYEKVAATIQAFMNDPDTILALVARDRLEESLDDLREMETVFMDIDDETEALVPRPSPDEATRTRAAGFLDEHAEMLDSYREVDTDGVEEALPTDLDWNVESGGDVGGSLPTSVDVDRSLDAGLESPTDEPPDERPTRTEVRAEDISFAGAADDGEGDSGVRTTRYDEE